MNQEKNRIFKLKRLKYKFGVGISILFTFIIVLITSMVTIETNRLLTGKVLSLAYDLNSQTRGNLDAYINFYENNSLFLFSHEEYVDYNPNETTLSEYQRLELEGAINSYLYDMCILGDYVDFIVAYEDGHVLGRLSEDTNILFDNKMYQEAMSYLQDNDARKCWITGYKGKYTRIYFVRKLNDGAVFMSSIYSSMLGRVIEDVHSENTMHLSILNERNEVIYDSDMSLLGTNLSDSTSEIASIDEDTLTAICKSKNDWQVMATADTSDILQERTQAVTFVILIAIIAIMIAVVASVGFTFRLIVPEERLLSKLYDKSIKDEMTGLYERSSFIDESKSLLANNGSAALVYIDVDGMKHLNYKRGHEYGDEVIIAVADAMRKVFGSESVLGRVDGEEFAAFVPMSDEGSEICTKKIEEKCGALNHALHHYLGTRDDKAIAVSMGVCMAPDYGKELGLLYDLAERAMYAAKKDAQSYHFYDYTKDYNIWTGSNR